MRHERELALIVTEADKDSPVARALANKSLRGLTLVAYDANAIPPTPAIVSIFALTPWLIRATGIDDSNPVLIDGDIADIPTALLPLLRRGSAKLLLDNSAEGWPFQPWVWERLHRVFAALDIPLSNIVLTTQNILLDTAYSAWCEARSVNPRISILSLHSFLRDFTGSIRDTFADIDAVAGHLEQCRAAIFSDTAPDKKFLAFNYKPKSHRVLLALHLLKHHLLDDGFVSFHGLEVTIHWRGQDMRFDIEGYGGENWIDNWPIAKDLVDALPDLEAMGTLKIGGDGSLGHDMVYDVDPNLYFRSAFSIVTESEMSDGSVWRITEKTIKPLVNCHPIIVLGNPGSLAMVRQLGFQTFHPYIDESYDEELDPDRRMRMVFAEIDRLCAMTPKDLQAMRQALWPVLVHNARFVIDGLLQAVDAIYDQPFLEALYARAHGK